MPVPDTQGIPPFAEFEDVKRKVNEIVQKYNNLLVNLDSLNVVSLVAEQVIAGKMIGFVIQTNNDGAYPNIIFTSDDNLIQAFSDADNHVDMTTNAGSAPGLAWYVAGALKAYLQSTAAGPLLASFDDASITLQPSKNMNFTINDGDLTVNNLAGYNGPVYYVKNVLPDGSGGYYGSYGTMTFTKGILTSVT